MLRLVINSFQICKSNIHNLIYQEFFEHQGRQYEKQQAQQYAKTKPS